jgi:hypothetical protein
LKKAPFLETQEIVSEVMKDGLEKEAGLFVKEACSM